VDFDFFSQFINEIHVWPHSETEWRVLARFLSRFFSVPRTLLFSEDFKTLYAGLSQDKGVNDSWPGESWSSFIEECSKKLDHTKSLIHFFPFEQHPLEKDGVKGISQVVIFSGRTLSKKMQKTGLNIVLGLRQALSREEEVILTCLGIWLNQLAYESDFQSERSQRNQFLALATHELKTPLTAIYGMLQLRRRSLQAFPKDQENQKNFSFEAESQFYQTVIRQVERLKALIDDLLSVSRIEEGRLTIQPVQTHVSQLIQECVQSRLKILAREASVSLKLDLDEGVWAEVDPMRVEEILTNLVMNSIRFSPEGGMISLTLKQGESFFKVSVKDQGPTVSSEDRERIFQPFESAQKTSRFGGVGLGLYISREIARLHGGDVVLKQSVAGQGNLFEAILPIKIN
jgi:signal transduction histidine kinase